MKFEPLEPCRGGCTALVARDYLDGYCRNCIRQLDPTEQQRIHTAARRRYGATRHTIKTGGPIHHPDLTERTPCQSIARAGSEIFSARGGSQ